MIRGPGGRLGVREITGSLGEAAAVETAGSGGGRATAKGLPFRPALSRPN